MLFLSTLRNMYTWRYINQKCSLRDMDNVPAIIHRIMLVLKQSRDANHRHGARQTRPGKPCRTGF